MIIRCQEIIFENVLIAKSCRKVKDFRSPTLQKKKMTHNDHFHKFKNKKNDQVLSRNIYTVFLIFSSNLNVKSIHSSESRLKESSLQKTFDVRNQANERYVTFQFPQFISKKNIKHSKIFQKSNFNNDYEVTILNHQIEDHEETIFILDYFSHRLRLTKKKKPKILKKHIKKLTKEIEYLRQELTYYKNIRKVLMMFMKNINESHRMIKNALYETFKNVAIFEQRFLNY